MFVIEKKRKFAQHTHEGRGGWHNWKDAKLIHKPTDKLEGKIVRFKMFQSQCLAEAIKFEQEKKEDGGKRKGRKKTGREKREKKVKVEILLEIQ